MQKLAVALVVRLLLGAVAFAAGCHATSWTPGFGDAGEAALDGGVADTSARDASRPSSKDGGSRDAAADADDHAAPYMSASGKFWGNPFTMACAFATESDDESILTPGNGYSMRCTSADGIRTEVGVGGVVFDGSKMDIVPSGTIARLTVWRKEDLFEPRYHQSTATEAWVKATKNGLVQHVQFFGQWSEPEGDVEVSGELLFLPK